MKKLYIVVLIALSNFLFSQNYWKQAGIEGKSGGLYYSLDLDMLRSQLRNSLASRSESVLIYVPNLEGKTEAFRVKSYPVMDASLAERYQLESYSGVSVENPARTVRLSVSPYNFQSMISDGGQYEFVDPERSTKNLYRIHEKSLKNTEGKPFECSTSENPAAVKQLNDVFKQAATVVQNPLLQRASDKKYRTLRLALSVTGEYTQYFGGVPQALAQMNATLTRVNGVYEKELALHLNMIDAPGIIFTDPATDPYSPADVGAGGAWNMELQKTLTKMVGEANYDIGHLFGASGGGGNAGCIGCVCKSPALDASGVPTETMKGSGFTSPGDGKPFGDNFDIDYVSHEIGHQLGANHTFSHRIEGTTVQTEPGSGSTIMGYAGITSANVQMHSDVYFHYSSFNQIQSVLMSATCDVETPVTNNPPVVAALKTYNIPKGTAFVLDASVTDAEGDPMTYNWEELDPASTPVTKVVSTNTSGPNFRSLPPSDNTKRYFPKFSSVMQNKLTNTAEWESVSDVARTMNFVFTARDNNALSQEQQLTNAKQTVVVKSDGPFVVKNYNLAYYGRPETISWNVANTTSTTYGVANVKLDYTTDGGLSWNLISISTPNDGSETFNFPASTLGKNVQIRVTSIGNIFYAVSTPLKMVEAKDCSTAAPENFVVKLENRIAKLYWQESIGASYVVRYKKKTDTDWTVVNTTTAYYEIANLDDGVVYEVQVAQVCGGVTGTFTASQEFIIPLLQYCSLKATDFSNEYISNVKVVDAASQTVLDNSSAGSAYTSYFEDTTKTILLKRSTSNTLTVQVAYPGTEDYYETLSVWVDYNGDGLFQTSERQTAFIADPSNANVGTATKNFTLNVPATAPLGTSLKMRIALKVGPSANSAPSNACNGALAGSSYTTAAYKYGEVEDYRIKISE